MKNTSENVGLFGLDSPHRHEILSYKMTILSFFLPCHNIVGFKFSAF